MSDDADGEGSTSEDYHGRVTVDLDGYADRFRYKAVRAWNYLRRNAAAVDVHISSSGEGLHLVGWYRESLTFADRLAIRRELGDDGKRIEIDAERARNGVYTGVLWSRKSSNPDGEKQRDFADVWAALDHMDMTNTTDAERMYRLANHGHKAEPSIARAAHGEVHRR